ncbi:hypothetical protein Pelo_16150 [Pelomyxa schiedti]|nr:hypothetical protein Pelo_16150 [Pelomyxa schiedti]
MGVATSTTEAASRVAGLVQSISSEINAPILENVEITERQLGHGGFAGVFLGHWIPFRNKTSRMNKGLKDSLLDNITQFFGICARDSSLVLMQNWITLTS